MNFIAMLDLIVKQVNGRFSLNPETGLDKQLIFWVAILLPITLSLILGFNVWCGYVLSFDTEGYSTFLNISKLPIAVSSLSIPLGVLVGKLHSAKQTARQIIYTQRQIDNTQKQITNSEQDSKMRLYLAHFEHFVKHMDIIEASLIIKFKKLLRDDTKEITNKINLYKALYPDASLKDGVLDMSDHIAVFINNNMTNLSRSCRELNASYNIDDLDKLKGKVCHLENLLVNLQIKCFFCLEGYRSIFKKYEDLPDLSEFIFGINEDLDTYESQMLFFIELLDGIESFEIKEKKDRVAEKHSYHFRVPHRSKSSNNDSLIKMWNILKHKLKAKDSESESETR